MLYDCFTFEEYNEPTAQNTELSVNDIIPIGFKLLLLFPVNGFIRIISPENPKINPTIIVFDKCCLNIIEANMATHKGIVEFNNAVIPDDRYCAPHTSNPWPPKIIEAPSIMEFFHCVLFRLLNLLLFFSNAYAIKSTNPAMINRIPKASNGGITLITAFIARKLDPQRTDRVTRTNKVFVFINVILVKVIVY